MLPEITLLNADRWRSPDGVPVSRPRFVTKYELEIYDSDGGETCIDGERHILCDGTVSFSRPGQIRNSKFPFSTTFIYFDFERQGTAFERRLDTIPTFSEPDKALAVLFSRIRLYYKTDIVRAEALLVELICRLSETPSERTPRRERKGQAELYQAIRYMKENLDRQLTLSEMAAAAGYSISRFSELFGRLCGMTPQDYFRSLRLGEAKRRLISGMGTSEVAATLGFGTVSHFCGLFKRTFGMTPGEFAKGKNFIDYES